MRQLNTLVVYHDVLFSIIRNIDKVGLILKKFNICVTDFTVTEIPDYQFDKDVIDIEFDEKQKEDIHVTVAKMDVKFAGKGGIKYHVLLRARVRYGHKYTYDHFMRMYLYTYMKACLERDLVLRKLYPEPLSFPDKLFIGESTEESNPFVETIQMVEMEAI